MAFYTEAIEYIKPLLKPNLFPPVLPIFLLEIAHNMFRNTCFTQSMSQG